MSAEPAVEVSEVTVVDGELLEAWSMLVSQLSSSAPAPERAQLEEVVAAPATTLFVARLEGRIVGSLTLVAFRIPTGMRAIIEDVVTDEAARGRGVGTELTRAAIRRAQELGCRSIDLTSRPSREAANRLYQQLGFERRETNVYRYEG